MAGTGSLSRQTPPARPPTAAARGRLSYAIFLMARAHRAYADRLLQGLGLQAGHEHVLMRLYERDGQSRTELLEELGLDDPTIAAALNSLTKNGIVRVEAATGGSPRVWLTELGHALRPEIERVMASLEKAALSALGDQVEAFLASSKAIAVSIDLTDG